MKPWAVATVESVQRKLADWCRKNDRAEVASQVESEIEINEELSDLEELLQEQTQSRNR